MIAFRGCTTVIQLSQLSSTTGIHNCHPQLRNYTTVILTVTTAIHSAATSASHPNHSAWSTASSPWHVQQQRHWGSCACFAGSCLRSLVSERQSLRTCPATKIWRETTDNWQAGCAEVGPKDSWHMWGLPYCTLPVQALPGLTANEGKGCCLRQAMEIWDMWSIIMLCNLIMFCKCSPITAQASSSTLRRAM